MRVCLFLCILAVVVPLISAGYNHTDVDAIKSRFSHGVNATVGRSLSGSFGVDVSSWVGVDGWTCLKNNGVNFAIVRGWESLCQVDEHSVHTVANAHTAGIQYVDVYLFPAYSCSLSPEAQVDGLINYMGGIPFGMIWLDIEEGGGWSSNAASNLAWIQRAAAHIASRLGHQAVGIYSSAYEWGQVLQGMNGGSLTQYPLWYAHYDGQQTFGDFKSFGGFSHPNIKQYNDGPSMCGVGIDYNWYP